MCAPGRECRATNYIYYLEEKWIEKNVCKCRILCYICHDFFTLNLVRDSNRREVDLSDTVLQNCVSSDPLSCFSDTSG